MEILEKGPLRALVNYTGSTTGWLQARREAGEAYCPISSLEMVFLLGFWELALKAHLLEIMF